LDTNEKSHRAATRAASAVLERLCHARRRMIQTAGRARNSKSRICPDLFYCCISHSSFANAPQGNLIRSYLELALKDWWRVAASRFAMATCCEKEAINLRKLAKVTKVLRDNDPALKQMRAIEEATGYEDR